MTQQEDWESWFSTKYQKGLDRLMTTTRPTHSDIFMEIAEAVAQRATCPRRHVGAVLVRNNRVIATGYNGSVPGGLHCDDVDCLMVNGHCRRTIHAELNTILQCARQGISCDGADLFVTTAPCSDCMKLLVTAGVHGIFFLDGTYVPEYTIQDLYGIEGSWYVQKFSYTHKEGAH